jgi:transposase-like protein
MVIRIAGKRMYLWRAVYHEGEVLDTLVQRRRDKQAALRLLRKLPRKQGFTPKSLTSDKLGSYGAAFRRVGLSCPHDQGSGRTIARKTRIKSCDDASARCRRSNQPDRPSASSPSMPPSTTISTFSVT